MLLTLAQSATPATTAAPDDLPAIMTSIFSRVDALAYPSDMLPHLHQISIVWAVLFLAAGIICLLHGYKFYKSVTVVAAMGIGIFAGYAMGDRINEHYVVGVCLGLLLAVVSFPLMKYAVAAMGGLAGAFMGANLWTGSVSVAMQGDAQQRAVENVWIGALIGLIVCGMLAFVLFKLSIVLFTSVSGSTLAVIGGIALLLQAPKIGDSLSDYMQGAHAIVLPLLVFTPALIGLIIQETQPEPPAAAGAGAKPKLA